jgi:hypothetical protein
MKRGTKEFRGGFIKLHRSLLSSPIWESTPESWVRVFIALLLLANWKYSAWWDGTQEVTLEPGSVITSVKHLATVSGVSEKQVRGCFNFLQKAGMAAIKTANKYTLVSLTNWATYQNDNSEGGKQNGDHQGNQTANGRQSNGNSLRMGIREISISPLPPARDDLKPDLEEIPLGEPIAEGDEIWTKIRMLAEDHGSFAAALYRVAEQEENAEAIEYFEAIDAEKAANGGWGTDPVPEHLRTALAAEIDTWPAPSLVQPCTPQRAREVAA